MSGGITPWYPDISCWNFISHLLAEMFLALVEVPQKAKIGPLSWYAMATSELTSLEVSDVTGFEESSNEAEEM